MTQREWKRHIVTAVGEMECLKFFPTTENGKAAIMKLLDRMASTPAQLNWLVHTLIDRVGSYDGPDQIRALFCTRFRPKDGIEAELKEGHPLYRTAEQLEDEHLRRVKALYGEERPWLRSGGLRPIDGNDILRLLGPGKSIQ